jgi:hypothetical protein
MTDDPARDYEALRVQTAKLLNLDTADLSATESLQLDLASLLRLSLDALQGAALAGREIDLGKLQSCYGMLAKLLPRAVEAPPQLRESHAARHRLAELIDNIARVADEDEDQRIAELEAQITQLETEIDGKNAAIRSLGGTVVAKAATPTPPASPPTPEQTTSPPEPQRSPQPPLPPANAAVPRAYLPDI